MNRSFRIAVPGAFFVLMLAQIATADVRKLHAGLDFQTRETVDMALQTALETHVSGSGRQWSSARSNYSGRVTPVRTWRSRSGHFCRAFVEIIRLPSGVERIGSGRACRNDAGDWVRI